MSHVDYPRTAAGNRIAAGNGNKPGGQTLARRFRAWTTSSLRDFVYAGAVLLWSIAGFTVLVTVISVTASTMFLAFGVFVWIGFAYMLRWTTRVDRRLADRQRNERVPAVYRRPDNRGLLPLLMTVSSDRQTWKDLGWL